MKVVRESTATIPVTSAVTHGRRHRFLPERDIMIPVAADLRKTGIHDRITGGE
jgi:hypothetical protein